MINFTFDHLSEDDLASECKEHLARPSALDYFGFECPVHIWLDGVDLLEHDGNPAESTLLGFGTRVQSAVMRLLETGHATFELSVPVTGVAALELRDTASGVSISRRGQTIGSAPPESLRSAMQALVKEVRAVLLSACPELVDDADWGAWLRGEQERFWGDA